MYGAVNWFDESAAACAEMVADLIDALGVPWTPRHRDASLPRHRHRHRRIQARNITARTFETCRRIAETGVEPAALSRQIFDSYSLGRVRLTGMLLNAMELHHDARVASLYFDDAVLASCGATMDDTDGLVNLPLGAREIVAVALFKRQDPDTVRVSLRSKGRRERPRRRADLGRRRTQECLGMHDHGRLRRQQSARHRGAGRAFELRS